MKAPLICRPRTLNRQPQRGVTMILVALAMVAIIAMAALSIDLVSLYLAKEEAQRAADDAAVAAARMLVLSGITGDPTNSKGNWSAICGDPTKPAALAAKAVAQQEPVSGTAVATSSITVTYSGGNGGSITSNTDCSALSATAFGLNPLVTVQLTRSALPNFFSRIWGSPGNSVTVTATAEAFNPSNSGNVGNQTTGTINPVNPWCVKPWVVPNQDPLNPPPTVSGTNTTYCNENGGPGTCSTIVDPSSGNITNQGMSVGGAVAGTTGMIGETFWLVADCRHNSSTCTLRLKNGNSGPQVQPQANYPKTGPRVQPPPNLFYVPGQVGNTNPAAIPSCSTGDPYETAIEGCDQPTNYTCGLPPSSGGTNVADLTLNPSNATTNGVACLTHQLDTTNTTSSSGQDSFNTFAAPTAYPFQIYAGSNNPMVLGGGLPASSPITTSTSIASLPIYDQTSSTITPGATTNLTFIGFLQVFINAADNNGNVLVTVLNVAGCGNGTNPTATVPVIGNSPIPVRLITPPF